MVLVIWDNSCHIADSVYLVCTGCYLGFVLTVLFALVAIAAHRHVELVAFVIDYVVTGVVVVHGRACLIEAFFPYQVALHFSIRVSYFLRRQDRADQKLLVYPPILVWADFPAHV